MSSDSLQPVLASPVVLGVDVGGTKIAASLVDSQGRLLGMVRHPTDVSNPQATLDSIAVAAEQAITVGGADRSLVRGVGLGIPGLVDAQRGVGIASVNLVWRDVPVAASLEQRLGLSCYIENDVRAAALGESRYGAGRGLDSMVYLVLGTGIAAAVIQDGRVYPGSHGLAGGPLCKCGGRGCFEALASGPAIAARAVEKMRAGRSSLLTTPAGELCALSAEQVFQAAAQGDELALETVQETASYVAFVIQFLALAYDPQLFVLGGGVPKAGAAFLNPLLRILERMAEENWVFRQLYHPGLVQLNQLGEEIGVLGAATLVPTDT